MNGCLSQIAARPCCGNRVHSDDAGNRAFAAGARADDIATRAQLSRAFAAIVKALVKTQRRAFARQKQPIPPAIFHRQFNGAVAKQLRPGQASYRNAPVPPGARRKRAGRHRGARCYWHACPGRSAGRAVRWWCRHRRCSSGKPAQQQQRSDGASDRRFPQGFQAGTHPLLHGVC